MDTSKYAKLIAAASRFDPFTEMTRLGLSPVEIKEVVIEVLDPFFENKAALNKHAVELLGPEFINVLIISQKQWFYTMLENCLLTYRIAKMIDKYSCFNACLYFQPEINQSLSRFWSMFYLEQNKEELDLHEFAYEVFRNIGDIVEGLIKPYLKLLLYLIRIAAKKVCGH